MPEQNTLRDLADLQQFKGNFARAQWAYADIAVDAVGHATAEELLASFRSRMSDADARVIVGILLENNLTFDEIIEGDLAAIRKELGDAG